MLGSVTKRKDGRYQGVVELPSDGKRKRKFIYADSKSECKKAVNKLVEKIEAGNFSMMSKLSFGVYIEKWQEEQCVNLSPTTKDAYKRYIKRYINPILENNILSKILPIDIQKLVNGFGTSHSTKSCSNLIGILHKAFSDAVLNKLIDYNPCIKINILESKKYEYYVYNELQYNKLLEHVNGTVEEIPIVLAGLCGFRKGEIMGLTWNDINFETYEITIRRSSVNVGGTIYNKAPKTKSSNRKIKVPDYVISVLKNFKSIGYVYPNKEGNPTNGGNYTKKFTKILEAAKLPHTRFHDLRHFNATMMLKHGVTDKVAASRLGHSDINMTKKYQHVLESMENNSASILNSIITMDVKKDVK